MTRKKKIIIDDNWNNYQKFDYLRSEFESLIKMIARKYSAYQRQEDIDDAIQQIWTNIWSFTPKAELKSPFLKTLISRIAINHCISWNKANKNAIYFKKDNIEFSDLYDRLNYVDDNPCLNVSASVLNEIRNLANIDKLSNDISFKQKDNDVSFAELDLYCMELLKKSPEKYSKVWNMRMEGMKCSEIAKELNLTITQIYVILAQLKSSIKAQINCK